ncbi:MAG TPA: anti-sigma factor [Candidatus Acidoferrales bacterium]|nr:anti-sigma factor [Candidatus Acidoferrales bacterium]
MSNPKNEADDDGYVSGIGPHERFIELCAISTSGEITEEERIRLDKHLEHCGECRQALREFQAVADVGVPLLATALAESGVSARSHTLAEPHESAVASKRAANNSSGECDLVEPPEQMPFEARSSRHRSQVNWNHVWMSCAAAIMLTIALGIYSYQLGTRGAARVEQSSTSNFRSKLDALERQLSDAGHQREILGAQLAARTRVIRELRRKLRTESADMADTKNTEAKLEESLQNALDNGKHLMQQRVSESQALSVAQASLQKAEDQLVSLEQQRDQEQNISESLQAQVKDLNDELRQSQETVSKQQDLLADDRDIRDLMGARDLYIAEVYDVARDGSTRKPYGRVFYTRGKSLIFYAYDLDQQPGVKNASTFQAWGQSGPDRQGAINLGIFYEDNKTNKRWVLKSDDPRKLDEINAVFVTVEPRGGSQKPNGKSLLFASLRIQPNHP